MVNENGQNWKTLRKHLSPPLTNRKTPLFYAQSMNEVADELVNVMRLKALNNDGIVEGKIGFFKNMSRTMFTNFSYSVVNNSILESLIEDLMN